MSLEIVALEGGILEEAAALSAAHYRLFYEHSPLLPSRYGAADTILPLLRELGGRAPGVAALKDGRLAGYLLGMLLPSFRGKRAVFSPVWANSADLADSRRIYQEMYTHLSARWVANGCFTHLISMLAHDRAGIEALHWLGFGLVGADGMRDLNPIQTPRAEIEIRRATVQDIDQVVALSEALQRHMAAAPTFLPFDERDDRASHEEWLADAANAWWMAYDSSEAVAFMKLGPATRYACAIIDDPGTTSIVGAFTRENVRSKGIAAALLNRSLEWARAGDYERCTVDFEPMNVLAARFWMTHFQPICYGLGRNVNSHVAWAHEKRDAKDLW